MLHVINDAHHCNMLVIPKLVSLFAQSWRSSKPSLLYCNPLQLMELCVV